MIRLSSIWNPVATMAAAVLLAGGWIVRNPSVFAFTPRLRRRLSCRRQERAAFTIVPCRKERWWMVRRLGLSRRCEIAGVRDGYEQGPAGEGGDAVYRVLEDSSDRGILPESFRMLPGSFAEVCQVPGGDKVFGMGDDRERAAWEADVQQFLAESMRPSKSVCGVPHNSSSRGMRRECTAWR